MLVLGYVLSALGAAAISFLLGGIFSAVFKRQLQAHDAMLQKDTQPVGKQVLIGIFVANVAMAAALAYFTHSLDINSFYGVITLSLVALVGFVMPVSLGQVWEGKTWKWYIISNAINAVSLVAMVSFLAVVL